MVYANPSRNNHYICKYCNHMQPSVDEGSTVKSPMACVEGKREGKVATYQNDCQLTTGEQKVSSIGASIERNKGKIV